MAYALMKFGTVFWTLIRELNINFPNAHLDYLDRKGNKNSEWSDAWGFAKKPFPVEMRVRKSVELCCSDEHKLIFFAHMANFRRRKSQFEWEAKRWLTNTKTEIKCAPGTVVSLSQSKYLQISIEYTYWNKWRASETAKEKLKQI
jgi:hypothetical protein